MALMPVADAIQRILAQGSTLPAEKVALADCHGRTLAADLTAQRTQPPDAMSAMDGYAARAADVAKVPATLKVIGEVAAGHPIARELAPGEAARIFTGGVVPRGADTIVIQENTKRDGDSVTVTSSSPVGKHVRKQGIDFKAGDILLKKGRRLSDRDLMLAAGMNFPALPVFKLPKVAVLATGDELVAPGSNPKPGEIIHSNGYALAALLRSEGAQVIDLGIAKDKMDDIRACIRKARDAGADILLTTGGASVGDHDLVQQALKAEGLDLSFWKIAMRPGKPMMHGKLGAMHVVGVPGNPVSSYVCTLIFVLPLLRLMSGRSELLPKMIEAKLGRDMSENDERAEYMRASLTQAPDGTLTATPFPSQDSSLTSPLSKADCLLFRDIHAPAAKAGSRAVILKLG